MLLIVAGLAVSSLLFSASVDRLLLGIGALCCALWGASVGVFGCGFIPAVCMNRTTLEEIGGIPSDTFNKGGWENWRQIFGSNCCGWLIPTKPPVSGFVWSGIE
jgi:hypothetical protein